MGQDSLLEAIRPIRSFRFICLAAQFRSQHFAPGERQTIGAL